MRQFVITKCDNLLLQSVTLFYYKVRQVLLQSAKIITKAVTVLLQSAMIITKCDRTPVQTFLRAVRTVWVTLSEFFLSRSNGLATRSKYSIIIRSNVQWNPFQTAW